MTIGTGQRILSADILKHANASGYLDLAASTVLTIASGAVTQVQNFHRIAGQGGADDDLDTITAAADVTDGYLLFLRPSLSTVTITLKHGTGNINSQNSQDIVLSDAYSLASLVWDANLSVWMAQAIHPRLAALWARQGGSATDWTTAGTTDEPLPITPFQIRLGSISLVHAGGGVETQAVTFDAAFGQKPLVFVSPFNFNPSSIPAWVSVVATTGFTLSISTAAAATYTVFWLALGEK